MSTQVAPRIEPKNHREQEMLDVLLTHPWRVTDRELNPRRLKSKQKAIDAWMAAGLISRNGTYSWSEYTLHAIHADQLRDAYARCVKDIWHTITTAREGLAAAHADEDQAAQALIDTLARPGGDVRDQINAISRPVADRRPIETITAGAHHLGHLRVAVIGRGVDWGEVLQCAEDMLAAEQAERDAEAVAFRAMDPEADPLGGDA